MTNKELEEIVRRDSHQNADTCHEVMTTMLNVMKEALLAGEDVTLFGIGTFRLKTSKPRTVYYTGEPMDIPPQRFVRFYISPTLKQEVKKLPV